MRSLVRSARTVRLVSVASMAVLAIMLGGWPAATHAQAAGVSHESTGVREALARQLQQPGPMVVTQGGSGGSAEPSAPAGGELMTGLTTADSDTWRVPRQPMVSRIYASPVNYMGSDGAWHQISNLLVPSALGGYHNEANRFSLQIPMSLSSGVSLGSDGHSVGLALEGAREVLPSVAGDHATYSEGLASTDFEYVSSSTGVQDTATLKNASAPDELRFALSASAGLQPRQEPGGSIDLIDGQGKVWFRIPAPLAYPSESPGSGRALPSTLSPSASGWVLSVDTGESWLRSDLASGSVAVDPSIEVEDSQNCFIEGGQPATSNCSETFFNAGYGSIGSHPGDRHGLLRFNLSSLPPAATVLNAKLGLYLQSRSTTNTTAVGVYRMTRAWTNSATWETYDGTHAWTTPGGDYNNPAENSDASVNLSVGASTGWYYWYPTKMVQEWANGPDAPEHENEKGEKLKEGAEDDGLIVKDEKDHTVNNVLSFDSIRASINQPYLEVSYEPRGVGSEPQYTQLSTPLTDKLTMSVNAASGNLMLANEDMHIAGVDGVDFASTRYYNNLEPTELDLGAWAESMFVQATEYKNGDVQAGNGTGIVLLFQKQASGGYITPPGIKAKLCTSATTSEKPCPATWPSSEIKWRLVYEEPEERYVDFAASNGWALHFGNKYQPKLTATYTKEVDAITSWTDTRGRTIKYTVLPNSFYSEMKDEAGGRSTKYGYESEAKGAPLTSYTDANGYTTKYHYESGNLNLITDSKGNVTKLVYDSKHRISEIIRTTNAGHTEGPTTKFSYYEVGAAPAPCTAQQKGTLVKDADWTTAGAHETLYCSNVLDEVEKKLDAALNKKGEVEYNHETTTEFNPFGEQTSSTAAAPGNGASETGDISNLHYDKAGVNVECSVENGEGEGKEKGCPSRPSTTALINSYAYKSTASEFATSKTENPQGHTISSCYNGEGSCEGTTGPSGSLAVEKDQLTKQNELTFTYNTAAGMRNGTVASSTDADGHKTEYFYDEKGNLDEIKPPTGISPTTIKVDADSRPEVITDGAGHKETISYDKLDRITKLVYSGTGTEKTVSYEYDADGNISKREDSTGTAKYTVDALNRLTSEELPGSITHSYQYDNASNMTAFTDGGGTTEYKYNGLNELASMIEPKGIGTDTFAYDGDHRLDKITYPSEATETYKLEPATGRPETITPENLKGTTTVPTLSYSYKKGTENTSEIQTLTEAPSGATTEYKYDKLDRLEAATTTKANEARYAYTFDGAGNRIEQEVNLSGATEGAKTYYGYNSGNELECRQTVALPCTKSSSTELSGYEYDKAGEQTAIVAKGDTSGTTFAYNAGRELSTLTPSTESALSLSYGGTGQGDLIAKGAPTTLENSLLGITREITSGSPTCFERTPSGLLVDIRTPTANYNPLYDAQGDIIALVSSGAKVERTFHYGPYGENVTSGGTQTIHDPFGFQGGYRMPGGNKGETTVANGLYHFGERYYDPTTGRWTQQDPVNQISDPSQADRYAFVGDDPINIEDPAGTFFAEKLLEAGLHAGEQFIFSDSLKFASKIGGYGLKVLKFNLYVTVGKLAYHCVLQDKVGCDPIGNYLGIEPAF